MINVCQPQDSKGNMQQEQTAVCHYAVTRLCVTRPKSSTGLLRIKILILMEKCGDFSDVTFRIAIVVFTLHVPVYFWLNRHNFGDTELKFCILP